LGYSFSACKSKSDANNQVSTDLVNNPASATGTPDEENIPVMTFEKEEHEFGKLVEGEKVSYAFKFKNTGKADLIISDAKGSCGCTVPTWTKDPVAAGESGTIDITFDSRGKSGMQHKTVTLITNAIPNTKVLTISGEVTPAGK
jgi:Protein of unknown function (DUF1573)